MLKEMGVRGVKIQEVYSLDEQMLDFLPQVLALRHTLDITDNIAGNQYML